MSDVVSVLVGLVGGTLPGRPASPAEVLATWVEAVAPRGDGLDESRARLAAHALDGLVLALAPGSQVINVRGACKDRRTDEHGGDDGEQEL